MPSEMFQFFCARAQGVMEVNYSYQRHTTVYCEVGRCRHRLGTEIVVDRQTARGNAALKPSAFNRSTTTATSQFLSCN